MDDPRQWLEQHAITEVECLVPDINGILRGKVLPVAKFLAVLEGAPIFLPMSAFIVAVTGRYTGARRDGVPGSGHASAAGYGDAVPGARRWFVARPMCWPMPIIPTAGRGRWRRVTC